MPHAVPRSRAGAQARLPFISLRGLFRSNPCFPALTPFLAGPGRAAPVSAPSIVPDSTPLGSGAPANPDQRYHFDPADPVGTEPADKDLDDYVGSTIEKIAAVARQRASSAQACRATPS